MHNFLMILALPILINSIFSYAGYAAKAPSFCENAETIFTNADFITLNPKQPHAKAVAVTNGHLVAIGNPKDLISHCRGKHTVVTDLKGSTIVPGLIDTYARFILTGWLYENALDISSTNPFDHPHRHPVKTLEELLTLLQKQPEQTDEWLIISGYDASKIKGDPLSKAMLDKATQTTPTIIFFASFDKALLNEAAIKKLNHSHLLMDDQGMVSQDAFNRMLARLIPRETARDAIISAAELFAKQGYTTVTEIQGNDSWLRTYNQLTKTQSLPVDVVYMTPNLQTKLKFDKIYNNNNRLYPGPLLVRVDGLANHYESFLSKSYLDWPATTANTWPDDYLNILPHDLEHMIYQAYQQNRPIAFEVNGDAAIDLVINTLQKAANEFPRATIKPVLINAMFIRPDQLHRLKNSHIQINWFAPYLYYWGEQLCYEAVGPEVAKTLTPLQSASSTLNSFAAHTASPLTPPHPLTAMEKMVTRNIQKWHYPSNQHCPRYFALDERISFEQALKAFTIGAARLYGLETEKGSLEVGKLADMTLLSNNPQNHSPKQTKVLGTILRGKLMWSDSDD